MCWLRHFAQGHECSKISVRSVGSVQFEVHYKIFFDSVLGVGHGRPLPLQLQGGFHLSLPSTEMAEASFRRFTGFGRTASGRCDRENCRQVEISVFGTSRIDAANVVAFNNETATRPQAGWGAEIH